MPALTLATVDVPALSEAARARIDTPALVVDLDRMEAAVAHMAAAMADRGVALRPHAKTHKSLEVARRQIGAGAAGLTVGTIGEAEVFADGGIDDLFIAYPLVPLGPKAARLRALAARATLRAGVDSETGARAVADALGADRENVRLLIEIDSGGRRSGVAPDRVGAIARVATDLGLAVIGVFTHGGHGYAGPAARLDAADDEVRSLTEAADALRAVGLEPSVVSAGSTPTAIASARAAVTEERPGTYVFGDRQQVALGSIERDAVAAVVATRVTSVNAGARRFVVDAGAKMLGKDVATYMPGHGEIPELGGAVVARVADYHGIVDVDADSALPEVGQVVMVVPNHICPVVNYVDAFLVARGGEIVESWPVDARGRNG
ncbi:MAG TPA: alanine racemase [Candidatus Limnocylindrales bacterium]|jgi:D-serine deaminase-like pyridoxal phosphate-dependent protein|nr:alanine racemase [Candidatus Limnocylindrales bacterium]